MSIGYAEHLVENLTKLGESNQGLRLQPFELLDIAKCIQELLDSQPTGYVCPFCGTTDPEKHRCPDCKERTCSCEDEAGHENCPNANITVESFKRAIDMALSGQKPYGKLPSGLNREEFRYFCLGVITEEDFTTGKQEEPIGSHSRLITTQRYLTEHGRRKIEAVKVVLGDWPDPFMRR